MLQILKTVDRLLRGEFTPTSQLSVGKLDIPVRDLLLAGWILGEIYGLFMGLYGVLRPHNPSILQFIATVAKVPLLFLLTLLVTLPSLYVFSTLAGSPLRFRETCRFLLIGIVVHLALLSSFGPVTGFFTLCTESYPFMVVLNVLFFASGGLAGLLFLRKGLKAVFAGNLESGVAPPTTSSHGPARLVLVLWMAIYGAVGAQMGWILRPFIGAPGTPFSFFRDRQSNFFEALARAVGQLFS